jgi:hypothetical protein
MAEKIPDEGQEVQKGEMGPKGKAPRAKINPQTRILASEGERQGAGEQSFDSHKAHILATEGGRQGAGEQSLDSHKAHILATEGERQGAGEQSLGPDA